MQLTYVFSELGNGLKRNISMTVAVITTIFVSLTLVALGLLLSRQAHLAENYLGDRLQITVFMCSPVSSTESGTCIDGKATEAQKQAVEKVLASNPEVKDYHYETSQQAYSKFRSLYENDRSETQSAVLDTVTPEDFPESYWVTLKDPKKFQGVKSEVAGLKGVDSVRDLRDILKPLYVMIAGFRWGALGVAAILVIAAVLQVGTTIRLSALARRREIGIMRLVGASNWYIRLPFLLESVFAALIGIALAGLAILVFMGVVIYGILSDSHIMPWVSWGDAVTAIGWITLGGLALTVIPTQVLTRKYLKV